ncbi:MAG TPA: peptidase M28, partial [Gemmatimonadaceae bacterium]|nr:peptidase M28 [Gemmatimonadaceae bacterium]
MNRKLVLVLAVMALPAARLRAQTGINDPVLERMWRLGTDSSHTWDLAQVLFDSVGPRLTGTPAGNNASDWVMKMYRSWGIDARREQYGTWRGWRRGPSHVDLVKPFARSLEATMEGYSPGTGGKDVLATTVILPMVADSSEFVRWLPSARGKYVLISAAYPTCRPEEEWDAMATPASKARMDTAIVKLVNDWTARIRNTGYPVTAGNPTGNLGVR